MARTRVASAATDTQLLARDPARRAVTIENSDPNRMYIGTGPDAVTTDNYSWSLNQGDSPLTVPRELAGEEIRAIWAADGSGYAQITYGPGVQG
jgi:hypothetical protein